MLCSSGVSIVVLLGTALLARAGPTAPLETLSAATSTSDPILSTPAASAAYSSSPAAASIGIEALCFPTDPAGNPYTDAPCNQVANLSSICNYGSEDTEATKQMSPSYQQQCYCDGAGAAFFEILEGCFNCERLHGDPVEDGWYPIPWVEAQSSSYCAIPTPTQNLEDFLGNWTASDGIYGTLSTGGSDVLGTSTQVSLYFTSTMVHGATTASTTSGATSGARMGSATGTAAAATSPSSEAVNGQGVSGIIGVIAIGAAYWGLS